MKTTIEIRDDLLRAAKKRAIDRGVPLRALVEKALEREVADGGREARREPTADWEAGWGAGGDELASLAEANETRRAERHRRLGVASGVSTLPVFEDPDPDLSLKVEEILAASWQAD